MKTKRNGCSEYQLTLEWNGTLQGRIDIDYAQDTTGEYHAILRLSPDGVHMVLQTPAGEQELKHDPHVPEGKVVFLRRGNYARALYDGQESWLEGGTGEWLGHYMAAEVTLVINDELDELTSCVYAPLTWLKAPDAPVVPAGPDGSFYEQQIIAGAVIEHEGTWYMYGMCGIRGDEEGSAKRVIGVATSQDLINWTVLPKPLIDHGVLGVEGENLYPNACIKTDDGKFMLFFSAQAFPRWIGVYAMVSDSPLGPFVPCEGNPVVPPIPGRAQHEFDLVECNLPQGRYLIYLTTYTPAAEGQRAGDRGLLYFSDDLLHWRMDTEIGLFGPETKDGWDAAHVRTRGLNRIGDTWYLWYEGVNYWKTPKNLYDPNAAFVNHAWWDVFGLARSRDLKNWEYYPLNPCVVPQGRSADRYDNRWVGWPRMIVKDGKGYIFHSCSGDKVHVGLRIIDIDQLTDWESDLGPSEKLI